MCLHVLPACMSTHHMHLWCSQRPEGGIGSLKLELDSFQYYVGTANQIFNPWKSSQCSELLSPSVHLSSYLTTFNPSPLSLSIGNRLVFSPFLIFILFTKALIHAFIHLKSYQVTSVSVPELSARNMPVNKLSPGLPWRFGVFA